jgi:hypothetical protein
MEFIFCYSGDQIEKNEVGGACGTYVGEDGVYRVLVGKPEGKGPSRGGKDRSDIKISL